MHIQLYIEAYHTVPKSMGYNCKRWVFIMALVFYAAWLTFPIACEYSKVLLTKRTPLGSGVGGCRFVCCEVRL